MAVPLAYQDINFLKVYVCHWILTVLITLGLTVLFVRMDTKFMMAGANHLTLTVRLSLLVVAFFVFLDSA